MIEHFSDSFGNIIFSNHGRSEKENDFWQNKRYDLLVNFLNSLSGINSVNFIEFLIVLQQRLCFLIKNLPINK